jgi:ketosteroid isomerase-like protein
MTSGEQMKNLIRSTYASRVRGDVDGTADALADDATFELNGRGAKLPGMGGPVKGKASIRSLFADLIANFEFKDWQEISLIAEGDKAALHWRATVTYAPNGRSETFDVVDFITFRNGKIVDFRQNTDSAMILAMTA